MDIKELWRNTNSQFYELEGELIKLYTGFLRKVAEHYLKNGRRVFFRENRVVHWGEGNFGYLITEGEEDVMDEFGSYITEIRFEKDVTGREIRGYQEITPGTLEKITYRQDPL